MQHVPISTRPSRDPKAAVGAELSTFSLFHFLHSLTDAYTDNLGEPMILLFGRLRPFLCSNSFSGQLLGYAVRR